MIVVYVVSNTLYDRVKYLVFVLGFEVSTPLPEQAVFEPRTTQHEIDAISQALLQLMTEDCQKKQLFDDSSHGLSDLNCPHNYSSITHEVV